MKESGHPDDPFRDLIEDILLNSLSEGSKESFRSKVFAEVQHYSREVQEAEHVSDFFFRLCELIVDCQSLSVPDDSFRIIVAHLLFQNGYSAEPLEEKIRELIGMDPVSYEVAKEYFKNKECIASTLKREKTGKKGSIMAGKKNASGTVEIEP